MKDNTIVLLIVPTLAIVLTWLWYTGVPITEELVRSVVIQLIFPWAGLLTGNHLINRKKTDGNNDKTVVQSDRVQRPRQEREYE